MMRRPTRSLPVSLMKVALTPARPKEMTPLKTEPPGTAPIGWSFLKMISRMVSPIPITFRMVLRFGCKDTKSRVQNKRKIIFFLPRRSIFADLSAKLHKKPKNTQILADNFVSLRQK